MTLLPPLPKLNSPPKKSNFRIQNYSGKTNRKLTIKFKIITFVFFLSCNHLFTLNPLFQVWNKIEITALFVIFDVIIKAIKKPLKYSEKQRSDTKWNFRTINLPT